MRPLRDSGRRSIGSTRHGDRLPFTIRFSRKLVKFSAKGIDCYIAVGSAGAAADDDGDHAVVSFGEPIPSGHVLIKREHLGDVTSLEHGGWKRRIPSSAGRWEAPPRQGWTFSSYTRGTSHVRAFMGVEVSSGGGHDSNPAGTSSSDPPTYR